MAIEWSDALIEVVEKAALLRQDIERRGESDTYAARLNRLAQKIDALRAQIAEADPAIADAIKMAWQRPVRTLAFRNAEHRRRNTSD